MYTLKIINSTVRPGRKGPIITSWIADLARAHGGFNVEVLDLADINLPLMNEPAHPVLRQYQHEHTKQWSALIDPADAFIFVTAEYNYNYPAALRNALEYLSHEWAYKPAGLISYGGLSGGTRAINSLKSDLPTLRMVPLMEMVSIPFFTQHITEDSTFSPPESTVKSAEVLLRELARWAKGMKLIRENK
jgi:NAD(P)H-dependent FMN reductase